jgi:hypothetical protein
MLDGADDDLPDVVKVVGQQRAIFRSAQGRQQHGREDGDDGDDYQELDQGKTVAPHRLSPSIRCHPSVPIGQPSRFLGDFSRSIEPMSCLGRKRVAPTPFLPVQ